MGTLHLCGDLVMAVSVDEHKIVFLVVLMVSIHMMDFQYVFLSKVVLAIATATFLLIEQSGFPWGQQRTPT
jgi:hypothetical protein